MQAHVAGDEEAAKPEIHDEDVALIDRAVGFGDTDAAPRDDQCGVAVVFDARAR